MKRKPDSGVFEWIKGDFNEDDLKLSIIDFFDFQVGGWREFRYYLAKVEYFPMDTSLVGCQALIEVGGVDVVWEPKTLASAVRN